ncbi:hypothetical protein EON67_05790 [archaeon]|nr:MAG: hypothetical protein EON67_05790 [archaeon]
MAASTARSASKNVRACPHSKAVHTRVATPPRTCRFGVQDTRNNQWSTNYTYFFNFGQNFDQLRLTQTAQAACATTYPGVSTCG